MSITRRTILAAAPAAAAATTIGSAALAQTAAPAPAPAQPPAQAPAAGAAGARQAPGFYRYKVGDVEVTAVHDGSFAIPTKGFVRNAEQDQVDQVAQDVFMPAGQVVIPITTLVLNQGGRVTLLDTSRGAAAPGGNWMANLRAAGFDPAQVNTIVISHFHGDHIGGIRGQDGAATFPNAEVMVPAQEWAFWMDDGKMSQAPDAMKGAFQNVRRVFGPIAKDVKQYEGGKEIVPGLTTVAAPGHTPGHTAFMLSSGQGKLMVMSDTTNHPALFVRNPDWAAVFDMDADQARQTRRKLLDMAAAEKTRVSFYHAPFPATGYIAKEGNGFRFVPAQWTGTL
ncbi:MAG TPA: MBL fold metallo-hydrolase [Microvirga sp.]|jgi:glyoxylase-like metal-dependent hydrolase (beta-lactamase superfamily II)|nr:MBL fold metallo-hydrolase [Microvirga sp.]